MKRLLDSLPQGFDFYHLGRIEREPEADDTGVFDTLGGPVSDDRAAIAFAIQGEATGLLVLRFDAGLDRSVYAEAGNILASQLVADLEQRLGLAATLTPPRELAPRQLARLLESGGHRLPYLHRQRDGSAVRLEALLIPASPPSEGTGNA